MLLKRGEEKFLKTLNWERDMSKTVKNHCASCDGQTNHEVIGIHSESGDVSEYHYMLEHAVVKCCGCESVSFRKVFHDYENVHQIADDEWDYDLTVDIFPKKAHGKLDLQHAPEVVKSIYDETCNAFSDGSHTLAIQPAPPGLRAEET